MSVELLGRARALREEARSLNAEANAVLTEKRDGMSPEDAERHDRLFEAIDAKINEAERLERQVERNSALTAPITEAIRPGGDAPEQRTATHDAEKRAFNAMLRGQGGGQIEFRNMQAGSATTGGNLFDHDGFAYRLIKGMDDNTFVRRLATIQRVPRGTSLGMPTLTTDVSDADWTGEIVAYTQDTSLAIGRRVLTPTALTKQVRISKTLLAATPNAEEVVLDRLAYKFAVSQEKGFLTGNGSSQPLGVFTASADGVPTTRNVKSGSETNITYAGLVNTIFALKEQYHARAVWICHRDFVKLARQLVDSESRPLYTAPLERGVVGNLMGYPVYMSEYAPNTFTHELYAAVFGDFTAGYLIGEALEFSIQRLVELYAATNQDAFHGRAEIDGQPVVAEAFARVICDT